MYTFNTTENTDPTDENPWKNVIAVSNRTLCSRPFAEQLEQVCRLHPKALILREKDMPEEDYLLLAKDTMEICGKYHVPCILHTYVNAARKLHCTSIHLPLFLLRKYQGKLNDFISVGTSVHSTEEAQEAQKLGATYLTAGHIYTTDCKKGLPPRGLDFLEDICRSVTLPVYAIGGISPGTDQISEVMKHGASGGCIMSGMMRI